MKIAIITYSRTRNYGGILQAFGLYRYLELKGHDVFFIDYVPPRCNIENKKVFIDSITAKSRIWNKNRFTKFLFYILRYKKIKQTFKPFLSFLDSRCNFSKKYYTIDELMKDVPKADLYITGSDQVWNSQFSPKQEPDLPFYLPFVNNKRKISYASSFGTDSIPEKNKEQTFHLLSSYSFLSVREESGANILKGLGLKADVVLDPTLLCPASEWRKIESPSADCNYLLLYLIKFDQVLYNMSSLLAKKLNKKLIVVVLDGREKHKVNDYVLVAPPIEKWLFLIDNAHTVITDSFHACVFSILFNTSFIVNSVTRKEMSTRIINLLDMFGLDERLVNSIDIEEMYKTSQKETNWKNINSTLKEKVNKSRAWLEKAITIQS